MLKSISLKDQSKNLDLKTKLYPWDLEYINDNNEFKFYQVVDKSPKEENKKFSFSHFLICTNDESIHNSREKQGLEKTSEN